MSVLEATRASFARFAQIAVPPERREDVGLQAAFRRVFPSSNREASLEYVSYALERPRRDADECALRGMTWAAPLKTTVRLVIWEGRGEKREVRDIKEQELYFGEVPLMTERGTFVVAGAERVLGVRAGEWLERSFLDGLRATLREAGSAMRGTIDTLMPHDILNARPLMLIVRALFEDPARCPPAIVGNPVARIEQIIGHGAGGEIELPELDLEKLRRSRRPRDPRPPALPAAWAEAGSEVLAPFAQDPTAARAALCAARVLVEPERPRALAGPEQEWARDAGLVRLAGVAGEVIALSSAVVILPADGSPALLLASRPRLVATERRVGGAGPVAANDAIFESAGALDGHLALGRNARVAFDASVEGAIVSERFARAMRATDVVVLEAARKDTRHGVQERAFGEGVDASGVVPLGARVAAGQRLFGVSAPNRHGDWRDASLRATKLTEGAVVHVEIFARRGQERSERHAAIVAERERVWTELGELARSAGADPRLQALADERPWDRGDDLPPGVVELVRIAIERELPLAVGARISDRRGFGAPVARVDADLDVDLVLPGPAPEPALREIEQCGSLYVLHLPPARALEPDG